MNKQILAGNLAAFFVASCSVLAQPKSDTPLWVYEGPIATSPALGPDGTVYFGGALNLFAVTNAGTVGSNRWVFPLTNPSGVGESSPTIGPDGTIYIAAGNLYAVNPDGSQKWSYAPVGIGSPALGLDNSVYVQGFSDLHAVSPAGLMRWKGAAGGNVYFCSPSVGTDGSVYIFSPNVNVFYGLDQNGIQKWYASLGPNTDSPAIAADGTVYFGAGDGVYAFSPKGTLLWLNRESFSPGSSLAIGKDGIIYVGSTRNLYPDGYGFALSAITPAGQLKWQVVTNMFGGFGVRLGTPAIDSAGTIYYAAYNMLFAFSPEGAVLWRFSAGALGDQSSNSSTSPAIGPDGTIYAQFGSKLYAFAGTNTLADAPWPMYHQNARHTGKVEKAALKPLQQKRSDGNFQFELYAQLGQTNTVESTTNLSTWTSLDRVVATNVPMDVVDLTATNFPTRFYRTSSP